MLVCYRQNEFSKQIYYENTMNLAKKGDKVRVHYTGTLDDGIIFDDSLNRQPLEFIIGSNQLIAGFEKSVIGMKAGDWKTVKIPAIEAYGPYRNELLFAAGLDKLPKGLNPSLGQQLQITQEEDKPIVVTVIEIDKDKIILDANHPLAGKNLNFEIKLIEVITP
jgi:peptidylprolyl isomerase